MEKAVAHVDQRVLIHVGVSDPVGPRVVVVVVQRDVVVVGLVLRHGLALCRSVLAAQTHG